MCFISCVLSVNDYKTSLELTILHGLHEVNELYLSWQFHDII